MGWRERFGADDERARIAARARALLDAAGARPSPGEPSIGIGVSAPGGAGAAPAPPFPSPRGGWVPGPTGPPPVPDDEPWPRLAPGGSGRHARAAVDVDEPYLLSPAEADTGREVDARGGFAAYRRPDVADVVDADRGRPWRDRVRFDPGRRGLLALAAVVVVVASIAGGLLFRSGQSSAVTLSAVSGAAPSSAPVAPVSGATTGPPGSATSTPSSPAASASASAGTVTVDVAGLVARPGVYTLPAGSRVEDALKAAGGARPGADLSTLNRARVLVDGEQLAVGVPGAPAGPAVGSATGAVPGAPVDLNTADTTELDTLPGVGPVLAQAIVDWRTQHGRFASVDDLQQVSGIGPANFADLKDLVTV